MIEGHLVSVVIPVHNGERFLREALDSVACQDYRPIEVLAIDDGSTDAGHTIAASYEGIRYIRQEHCGVAAARNRGVAEARGDFLAFLDQDDFWLPHKLRRQMALLMDNPDVGYILAGAAVRLEEGIEAPPWLNRKAASDGEFIYMPGTWLVRRDTFVQVGGFDTSYQMASDGNWLARATDAGIKRLVIPDILCYWRIHGANQSYKEGLARSESLRILRESIQRKRLGRLMSR